MQLLCGRYSPVDTKNVEFFYNHGSLSGDELVAQVMHVITCCESAGVQIHGLVADAGGNNKSLFNLLVKPSSASDGWLNTDQVAFKNPYDPERWVFFIFCSVHLLKALQTATMDSKQRPWIANSEHG